jgi:hypothetical protein
MKPLLACALALALGACASVERTSVTPSRGGESAGTVRAAIAMLLASHPEDGEILALMDPRKESGADAALMARFLHVLAADRRRLREAAAARARDDRRALEALRSRAEAAQERAAQLQQKLDALAELEKSLSERQTSSR